MATSSITHNFVINDTKTAERFIESLDKPKIKKTGLKVEKISGDNVRLLVEKWKTNIK